MIILHGLFGAGRNWKRIAQALGKTHRVYLPDARNHGASPRGQGMSYAEMARDVLALIERERLGRPFVIGHSMGGKTAMTLALEHPQALAGPALFLAGAYSDYVRPESHAGIARMFPQARVHTIPHAGHWVHADQPEALLLTLRDWLEESGAPDSAWHQPPAPQALAARA